MEETGLENMTENTEKEKVLSKEEIVAALNERHSPEKQKLLSAGRVAIAGLGGSYLLLQFFFLQSQGF